MHAIGMVQNLVNNNRFDGKKNFDLFWFLFRFGLHNWVRTSVPFISRKHRSSFSFNKNKKWIFREKSQFSQGWNAIGSFNATSIWNSSYSLRSRACAMCVHTFLFFSRINITCMQCLFSGCRKYILMEVTWEDEDDAGTKQGKKIKKKTFGLAEESVRAKEIQTTAIIIITTLH